MVEKKGKKTRALRIPLHILTSFATQPADERKRGEKKGGGKSEHGLGPLEKIEGREKVGHSHPSSPLPIFLSRFLLSYEPFGGDLRRGKKKKGGGSEEFRERKGGRQRHRTRLLPPNPSSPHYPYSPEIHKRKGERRK